MSRSPWRPFPRTEQGPVFCPRCGWNLGRIESPAIDYLYSCGGCHRGVSVREVPGGVALFVTNATHAAEMVDLNGER